MSRGAAAATGAGRKLSHNMSWLWRGPLRALSAARDLYVNSLLGCAGHLPADAAFGYPTFAGAGAGARHSFAGSSSSTASSRRFSAADADEDLRELIRAASHRRSVELERQQRHPAAVSRSQSVAATGAVAMARIDEDGPCDFASAAAFPRSRSCAAPGAGTARGAGRRGRVAAVALAA